MVTGAAWAVLALAPVAATAQALSGQIVDSASSAGLPAATVALVDSAGTARFHTRTDSLGWYRLRYRPGRYRIRVSHPGYETFDAELYDFGDTVPPNYIALARREPGSGRR